MQKWISAKAGGPLKSRASRQGRPERVLPISTVFRRNELVKGAKSWPLAATSY
jgi:hypothetical protein